MLLQQVLGSRTDQLQLELPELGGLLADMGDVAVEPCLDLRQYAAGLGEVLLHL